MKGRVKEITITPTLNLPHQGGGIIGHHVAKLQGIKSFKKTIF
jgi:hypothetical protein